MAGLHGDLWGRIEEALIGCYPLASVDSWKYFFVDERINLWRPEIPEERSLKMQVMGLMAYLVARTDVKGRNGLGLFLEVMAERMPPDSCRDRLADLAEAVAGRPADLGRVGLGLLPMDIPTEVIPDVGNLPEPKRMGYRVNPVFVGRATELRLLAEQMKSGGEVTAITAVAGVTGMGGIGKTQLAVEFVHRYGRYFPGGVFWLNFSQAEGVKLEVFDCGRLMGVPLEGLDVDEVVTLVKEAWSEKVPRLLIFDNCEDDKLLDKWRPVTGGSRVLMTTRRGYWGAASGVTALALDVLAREESVALLQKLASRLSEAEAEAVAEALGDFPLALQLAGSYLDWRSTVSVEQYLKRIEQETALQHRSLAEWVEVSPTKYERAVAGAFGVSYEQLAEGDGVDEMGRALLWRAALLAPGVAIPEELWWACLGEDGEGEDELEVMERRAEGVARLVALGLVTVSEAGWVVHKLVGMFVKGVMGAEGEGVQREVEEGILIELDRRRDAAGRLGRMPLLGEHLRYVTDVALERGDGPSAALSSWLGYYAKELPDYGMAHYYYERALLIYEEVLGERHSDTASSLNNMGSLLESMGAYEEAQPYYDSNSKSVKLARKGRKR
ncbi:MAG TPA: tetratricopeptide repeat protein [Anaerolineae bacterium]|nr:tetratricopeptide repeat protein [Anaerolineae bacterium]